MKFVYIFFKIFEKRTRYFACFGIIIILAESVNIGQLASVLVCIYITIYQICYLTRQALDWNP